MLSGLGRLIVLGGVSFCPGPRPAITRRVLSTAASSTRAAAAAAAGEASAKPSASAGRDEYLIHLKDPGNEVEILRCASLEDLDAAAERYGHLPQVCFAGESNAGKSSMLNHLIGQRVTRSSSVAGKTRTIDWIVVNNKVVLTDLPGLPARDGQTSLLWDNVFEPLFQCYMESKIDMRAMFFLHDSRWRVSSPIRNFVDEMKAKHIPLLLVLTKDDQLENPNQRLVYYEKATRRLDFEDGMHMHYAATNETPYGRKSRRQLLRYIETFVEAGSREACRLKLEDLARVRREKQEQPVPSA
mmetsp:Transcript_8835/g.21210  ORF Transcript_8835/g.21210 Transcript_8835/m.21210 type:complete len:299 (+) Transcript_8835:75-971(+)